VDQEVEAQLLLTAHARRGLGLERRLVVGRAQLAAPVAGPDAAHLGCLGERPDRGRGEDRKIQHLVLRHPPFGMRGRSAGHVGGDGREAPAHVGAPHPPRRPARRDSRGVGGQGVRYPGIVAGQRPAQHGHLVEPLGGERQPRPQLGIERSVGLAFEAHGQV
jgi:hypothetical protein